MHRGPGRQRARGKRVRQSWVSAGSTQHFEETKRTEEGTPSVREGSLDSQDTTPRRGQEKETPYTESEGQGPVWWKERIREDHCLQGMEVCGEKAHFLSSLLKALDGLLYVLLTRTKPPREKNKASTWFALSKSEVSSVVWIQPREIHLEWTQIACESPQGTNHLRTLSFLFYPLGLLLKLHWEGGSGKFTWCRYSLCILQWLVLSLCSVPPISPKWRESHSCTNRLKMRLVSPGSGVLLWTGNDFCSLFPLILAESPFLIK